MSGVSKLATASVCEKAEKMLKQMGKSCKIAIKLQAVIAAKDHGIKKVAEVFGITRPTLTEWIKSVSLGSFDSLFVSSGRGRKPKLSGSQLDEISFRIDSRHRTTCKQIKAFVKEKFHISISLSTANRIVKSLGFSYITPRPRHYKADRDEQEAFKKKSKHTSSK